MSIRWDPILVRRLAEELDELLRGSRLRALRLDGGSRDLVLLFRERTLLWRLHPSRGHPLLFPPREPSGDDLPFAARVRRVTAPDDERLVRLELLPVRGRRGAADLYVELLGNQWNAVVAERPDGTIRHVLVRREVSPARVVGATWELPSPPKREGSGGDLGRERWMELLEPAPPERRRSILVSSIAYASSINATALLGPAAERTGEEAHQALEAGWKVWRRIAEGAISPEPVILDLERGPQPYPHPLPGLPSRDADTLLDAFERSAVSTGEPGTGASLALLPPGLLAELESAVDGSLRRATRLEAELEGLEDAAALRSSADLLLAHYGEIRAGASEVVLQGFDGTPVRIPLDPGLQPHGNASRLYDRASRVERARERLPGLLARARTRASTLERLLESAREGTTTEEEIRASLPTRPASNRAAAGGQAESLPYRRYTSTGGLEIRVGRGARHNDDLTFHHSAPGDVWLHARHATGAHVVLRWNGPGNPPARDLAEAAVLAALHSKARTSGSVPVDWTLRKYVRKPKGSPPGRVAMERVHTLFVEPDPRVEDRLSERDGSG